MPTTSAAYTTATASADTTAATGTAATTAAPDTAQQAAERRDAFQGLQWEFAILSRLHASDFVVPLVAGIGVPAGTEMQLLALELMAGSLSSHLE